jgi:TolB-like protein/class 3 adenylate cyclase/Flp pilus assembly protein TadD
MTPTRRLAAIMAADVAGFSAAMEQDEEGTFAQVQELRRKIIEPKIEEHQGRLVKTTGDGFLAEFASPIAAMRCALAIQAEAANAALQVRIGLNLGDIIVEADGDVYGEGVNIAARLEALADPGGILISAKVHSEVEGKVEVTFEDRGEQHVKNIARPVRAYAVLRDELRSKTQDGGTTPSPTSAPHLSIVVLPFANIGGDPDQDHFVDGVTESLTTDLSRIGGAFVIARNTAFTFKGKAVDVKQIGRELDVRYVLEGSVQRGGKRLRVNVQLIDAETGSHLWAERFEKPVADLFDMQDEIVSRLANTLNAQLVDAEAQRAQRSTHPDAMDLYFQGRSLLNRLFNPENLAQARTFFERALVLEPSNIEALYCCAVVDAQNAVNYFTDDDRIALLTAAETVLIKVLSIAPDHAGAHGQLGSAYIQTNRVDQGIAESERALALDRNMAWVHANIGLAKFLIGRSAETEAHVSEALRLSPRDPRAPMFMFNVGVAKLWDAADAEAVVWLRRSVEINRNWPIAHFQLAAALAHLGKLDEARAAAQAGLALLPAFTVRRYRANAPSSHPAYLAGRERIYEGMRLAGIPE